MISKTRFTNVEVYNNKVNYSLESINPITEAIAKQWQATVGYHPIGYGFSDFRVTQDEGIFQATWVSNYKHIGE